MLIWLYKTNCMIVVHGVVYRYKDVVECERVKVWAFGSELHVSSFRAAAPSKEYLELVEKVLHVACMYDIK